MPWLILGIGIGRFALERAVPGWKLPPVRTWPLRVALANHVQLAVVLLAGATWVFYWWHRWRHESDLLWCAFQQIHHNKHPVPSSGCPKCWHSSMSITRGRAGHSGNPAVSNGRYIASERQGSPEAVGHIGLPSWGLNSRSLP